MKKVWLSIGMKAVALTRYLPITDPQSLIDVELPKPEPSGRDLLARVEAVSVNPVDTKVRAPKPKLEPEPRVLGWDAAGVVESIGAGVTKFKAGDEVYYAGDITRPGSNAEFHLVDERIVGRKPRTLSFAEAAALPLTTITAWEALFERFGIERAGNNRGWSVLIIGGAGGVGSIAIQLGKLAGLTVIATASRPETRKWVQNLGADHVIDHRQPLPAQLTALGHKEVDFIANFSNTDAYWAVMAEVIRPQGHIISIVENLAPVELGLLKNKSVSFTWEFMFTRQMFQTPDMAEQGALLDEVSALVDAGTLRTTLTEILTPINAANLRTAHAMSESGKTIGKMALAGWK
jgi:zinc-binding alcohol dehydrogenase family protein